MKKLWVVLTALSLISLPLGCGKNSDEGEKGSSSSEEHSHEGHTH